MRLARDKIRLLSETLVGRLVDGEYIRVKSDRAALARKLEQIIIDELLLEDRLNQEVDRILQSYEAEIRKGQVDYNRVFQMTKKQLAKDKGIIL